MECPKCGRKFNADVAERHVPKAYARASSSPPLALTQGPPAAQCTAGGGAKKPAAAPVKRK